MKIFLVSSPDDLTEKECHYSECVYIDLKKDKKSREFINKFGGKEIDVNKKLSDNRYVQNLVDEYIRLIGNISEENNNIYWWSTFTSSKNRFMTDAFKELCTFQAFTDTFKPELYLNKCEKIIIIVTPELHTAVSDYLRDSEVIFEERSSVTSHLKNKIGLLYNSIINRAVFLGITWYRIFITRQILGRKIKQYLDTITAHPYIIRTWIYERSFSKDLVYRDAFFGILPEYISTKKQLLIIGGIIGDYSTICRKIKESGTLHVIPQEFFLNYLSPIKTILNLHRRKISIQKALFFGNDVSAIINYELLKEHSGRTLPEVFQFSYFIDNMLKIVTPDFFLTTYENNPWEKVIFIRLRALSKQTRIIGYQHSVLSKFSLNMFFTKDQITFTPKPDKVITVGSITRDMLITIGSYDEKMVLPGCGLRFSHLFGIPQRENLRRFKTILVTPEGVPEESISIFNFVYESLKDYEGIKVIFRPHPALPIEKFENDLAFTFESVTHFEISDKTSVMEDLNRCDIVIYRGSTLALEALKVGLAAIYLDFDDLIPVDPLFGLSTLKWSVRTSGEIKNAIHSIYAMDDSEYFIRVGEMSRYLDEYFHKVTENNMDVFL